LSSPPSLGATGFVRGLPDNVRDQLLARGRPMRFARSQLIQQRGDPAREFWYVESGSVQVGRFSEHGRLTLFAVLGPGETFGELAFIGEFPRTVDAIAGSDAVLVRIGESEFQNLLQSEPSAARLLLQTMALTVQQAFDMVEAGRNLDSTQKLAQALLRLLGEQPDGTGLRITQQELADLVGLSRVSLGKAMKRLQDGGLVSAGYGEIRVLGRLGLEQLILN